LRDKEGERGRKKMISSAQVYVDSIVGCWQLEIGEGGPGKFVAGTSTDKNTYGNNTKKRNIIDADKNMVK